MAPMDLSKKTFCVISGASRGIGRMFAIELAKRFASGSHLVLLARSMEQLLSVREEIRSVAGDKDMEITVDSMDLQNVNESELKRVVSLAAGQSFDLAICVHNVGTIGNIEGFAATESDVGKWTAYFQVNLFNVILLNSLFLEATKDTTQRLVINVTSLCAIEAMKNLAQYCTGKAAREMFFKVLAQENADITVLNYSPGMVDTEMAAELRNNIADPGFKEYAQEAFEKKTLLSPLQTTEKMIEVVTRGEYKSGDHVDYHD